MLARIAHDLYWLGRNLARAEFTARAVEAVFQAEVQGTSDAMPSVSFGSSGLLAMLGDEVEREHVDNARALARLTLDADRPGSMLASVERAREGARTVRDVISAEMWEAINTTTLSLRNGGQGGWATNLRAPAGPYLAAQYVKQRTALIGAWRRARCFATKPSASSTRAARSRSPTWFCGCCGLPYPRASTLRLTGMR